MSAFQSGTLKERWRSQSRPTESLVWLSASSLRFSSSFDWACLNSELCDHPCSYKTIRVALRLHRTELILGSMCVILRHGELAFSPTPGNIVRECHKMTAIMDHMPSCCTVLSDIRTHNVPCKRRMHKSANHDCLSTRKRSSLLYMYYILLVETYPDRPDIPRIVGILPFCPEPVAQLRHSHSE